ncbi:hypothetical protein JG688_00009893 [Phytophthora aleatoria]|uniref:Uncharacterized protein n=1 Tax=Phytophthora aleatoria TaxID=2496075 RepID=A0A8J5J5L4_9STRA|nr:hypothetical protein JG688_00009893 [Phytophthora aleatoria]
MWFRTHCPSTRPASTAAQRLRKAPLSQAPVLLPERAIESNDQVLYGNQFSSSSVVWRITLASAAIPDMRLLRTPTIYQGDTRFSYGMAASLVASASVRLGTTVSVVSETKTCKSIDSLAMTSMHSDIMRRFVVMHLTSVGVGNFPCTLDVILADCMDGNPHGVLRALGATVRSHPVCFSKMLDVLGYPYSITF